MSGMFNEGVWAGVVISMTAIALYPFFKSALKAFLPYKCQNCKLGFCRMISSDEMGALIGHRPDIARVILQQPSFVCRRCRMMHIKTGISEVTSLDRVAIFVADPPPQQKTKPDLKEPAPKCPICSSVSVAQGPNGERVCQTCAWEWEENSV